MHLFITLFIKEITSSVSFLQVILANWKIIDFESMLSKSLISVGEARLARNKNLEDPAP